MRDSVAPTCSSCGAPAAGRFCAQCGSPLAAAGPATRERRAWRMAGGAAVVVMVILLATVLRQRTAPAPATPAAPAEAAGVPPDLSSMSPRERFDRLYSRVMGAAQSGDSATVDRFSPMAFAAYGQLDSVDADARYHEAILYLHVRGDTASALRLADTVLAANPRHLFGFLIRGMAGQLAGNQQLFVRAKAGLQEAWEGEMRAARPEYRDHQAMLEQFRGSKTP